MSKVVYLRPERLPSVFEQQTARCLMVEAFLRRRIRTFRTLATVSVVFDTELEAEQFHKLLMRTRRNAS